MKTKIMIMCFVIHCGIQGSQADGPLAGEKESSNGNKLMRCLYKLKNNSFVINYYEADNAFNDQMAADNKYAIEQIKRDGSVGDSIDIQYITFEIDGGEFFRKKSSSIPVGELDIKNDFKEKWRILNLILPEEHNKAAIKHFCDLVKIFIRGDKKIVLNVEKNADFGDWLNELSQYATEYSQNKKRFNIFVKIVTFGSVVAAIGLWYFYFKDI